MPPTSAARKAQQAQEPNRRTSIRQARTTNTRPQNYYARPFGSFGAPVDEPVDDSPPGFFPAIQYFTDAVTALPKEVMAHFTLMKEVEAKIHGPTQALARLSETILKMPVPPRRNQQPSAQALLSFTATNSANTSTNGSVINGSMPVLPPQQASDGLEPPTSVPQIDGQADLARRHAFQDLRVVVHNMIANLDEKNVVMAEANRALAQQLARVDHVIPHVEGEISEEARFGSLSHWAYADNRLKKQAQPAAHERSRRDVAATNSLAAAAAAMHDADIAAARGEPRREAKKSRHHVDSDFDDKAPKRPGPGKGRKAADALEPKGLGITNGAVQPAKRRKTEKAMAAAPAMERQLSGLKSGRGGKGSPRSTPAAETAKKKAGNTKATAPVVLPAKKRNTGLGSGANSPQMASSPLVSSFALARENSTGRPGTSSRNRQNSSSLLQNALNVDTKPVSRPASAADNRSVNGHAVAENGSHKGSIAGSATAGSAAQARADHDDDRMDIDDRTSNVKNEDLDAATREDGSGSASKTGTPLVGGEPMARGRSVRGGGRKKDAQHDKEDSSEPGYQGVGRSKSQRSRSKDSSHRKRESGAHILKQIASFNRSPVQSRRGLGSDVESIDGEQRERDEEGAQESRELDRDDDGVGLAVLESRRSREPRATSTRSRRNEAEDRDRDRDRHHSRPAPAALAQDAEQNLDDTLDAEEDFELQQAPDTDAYGAGTRGGVADEEVEVEEVDPEAELELEEDEDEPRYCYCGKGSFGEMIACDNEACVREWFHLGCVGLAEPPADNGEFSVPPSPPLSFLLQLTRGYSQVVLSGLRPSA
ncbi:hypothetical protein M8818_001894 [Zalaria obscura]|uniref:Uncharacterized protein n=1 Tax=Zalaria obscura TaxID=2024903 RepID=A0ACC3SKB2_9PEZI